jgi:AraC-like DNA-binding protein
MAGDGESNWRVYYLQLSELRPAELEKILRCSPVRYLSDCADLEPLFARVCRECEQPGVVWQNLVHALATFLIVEIGRRIANSPYGIAEDLDWENDMVGKAKWVIANSCRHGLTVGELAASLGISESGLAHRFSRETHESVYAYVRRMLMLRAQRLLEETHMSVTEIADALGFPTSHYFCRAFKKHVGASPTSYRRSFRNL